LPVSPAREIAYRILRQIDNRRGFAVDLLQRPEVSELREVDRRLATELVMGVLRWQGELDFQMQRLSGKALKYFEPEVAIILCLGIYQIRFLERIPKSAAVNEAVEMTKSARKRSATGLVNAVLRKCERFQARTGAGEPSAPTREGIEAACRCVPHWLLERWSRNIGSEASKSLAWATTLAPPITLRVRTATGDLEKVRRQLAQEGVKTRPARYAARALVVELGNVQAAKAALQGWVVIQDEASQLVAALVAPQPGQRVLDLCAAPGMKAGLLASALGSGLLVASDASARRLRTMAKLVRRGLSVETRPHLVRLDASRELPFGTRFDRILVDVPCSGTGTLARNPEIKRRLQEKDIARLAEMQEKMLRNALAVLALGGRLVYATCSLEPEENEEVVGKVLREYPGFQLLSRAELSEEFPALSELFDARGFFRTRPDLNLMDGFFAAVVKRIR
jgi:16S rRNA (cytosine967-C5)-methyltransferase